MVGWTAVSQREAVPDRERYAPGMERQLARLREALAGGMPRCGWKIGINVPEVLRRLGLRHPGVGWLDGRRRYQGGDRIALPEGARLHVEPELCLALAASIPPGLDRDEALRRVAGAAPAFELVDYARPGTDLDAVVAHSMFHAGLVVGAWQPPERASELGGEWPRLEAAGGPLPAPRSDLVPRHLGELLQFVARFLASFGESLEAGDLVLSGSYTETALRLTRGSEVRGDFGRLGRLALAVEP
jgi:2-keto-4-pentenoate hydratase